MVERLLAIADGDDASPAPRVEAFRLYVLLHLAAESWAFAFTGEIAPGGWGPAVAVGQSALAAIAWAGRARRLVTLVALLLLLVQLRTTWPLTANHLYLCLWSLGLLAFLDTHREREAGLQLAALRWLAAIVLAATGVQKLLYGTYFRGQFLAFVVAEDARFAALFRHLVPPDALARLAAIGPPEPGAGPYLVDSAAFVAASNLVWVCEIGLPVLMLVRRTRAVAATVAIVFLVLIETGARELFFGALFVNLVLLFYRTDLNRRLLPWFAALLAGLVLLRLWIAPGWEFN
jgi:hypothetical protein